VALFNFKKKPAPPKKSSAVTGKLGEMVLVLTDPKSAVAEAYRTIRTNLQFTNLDQSKKTFMVTSAGPGEGKTTTVANLGATMAAAGTRTLMMDTDLRRPALHKAFGVSNAVGLTSILSGQVKFEDCIQTGRAQNLDLLPSGPLPPNPAEVLMSRSMADLMARYDLVIYDSPPIISVSDSLVLGTLVDGVVLVVRSGGFPQEVIHQAKSQLEGVKANVVGVLLNSVNFKRDGYYYQYYYYYNYGYTYGTDGKK
jgi:capsular exopolysaccharide synthesis family protein